MGTYNYSGMYYKDGQLSFSGLNHVLWDLFPYYRLGNVSKDDLLKGEGNIDSGKRYKANFDAIQAREAFEKGWIGING